MQGFSGGTATAQSESTEHLFSGGWIRFLNVDSPGTGLPSKMESEWASPRTYMRWDCYNTRYGFSEHSGVLWADKDMYNLKSTFFDLYFDMALLLLYNRVVLFRFSSDLFDLAELTHARLSGRVDSDNGATLLQVMYAAAPWHPKKLAERGFLHTREQFSRFVDLYLFPLVSNQQQGVELYSIFREAMDIDALYTEIKAQVSDSHDSYNSKVGREQNNVLFVLTIITFLSIPVSIMFALLGASEWLTWTKRRLGFADSDVDSSLDSTLRKGTVDDWFLQLVASALLWGLLSITALACVALVGNFGVARMVAFNSGRYLGK
ncbi:hypothetical protein HDU93_005745 [Gonapodya sp. JEL0774]|nr:hypothetical protein HDU93_005745 [Gonapodya sp. JEL0774]